MSTTWTVISAAAFAVAAFNIGVFLHAWAGARCQRRKVRKHLDWFFPQDYYAGMSWYQIADELRCRTGFEHIDFASLERYVFGWMQEKGFA